MDVCVCAHTRVPDQVSPVLHTEHTPAPRGPNIPKQPVISEGRNELVKPLAGGPSELRLRWSGVSATWTQPCLSTPQPSLSP